MRSIAGAAGAATRRPGLRHLLGARSVAVVGASEDAAKVGYRPVRFLLDYGYEGQILPVNPRLETCQGLVCAPSVSALAAPPDVVVVVVRAALVPGVLREAATLGVRGAVVISSGFGETGPEGAELEAEVAEIARGHGMAVCGPNSVGIIHVPSRLALTFTEGLVRGELRPGRIGMVSQSGAFGTVIFAQAQARGLGSTLTSARATRPCSASPTTSRTSSTSLAYRWSAATSKGFGTASTSCARPPPRASATHRSS